VVDDIIQTVNDDQKTATISFTVDLGELEDARKIVNKLCRQMKCSATFEDHLAKVSVVGIGMQMHTGVAEKMFAALAKVRANIQNITTSEIKISCLIDRDSSAKALRAVHDAFDLGGRKKSARKSTRKTAKRKTSKAKKASRSKRS
jgi:aspartate kinase